MYHRVGTKQEDDVLIYKDDSEPDWMFDAEVTNDGKYLLICTRRDTNRINLAQYADITSDQCKNLDGPLETTKLVSEWIGEFEYL